MKITPNPLNPNVTTVQTIRALGARPQGYKLPNGYDLAALDDDALNFVVIARSRMENYIDFVAYPTLSTSDKRFYAGAAAAINDLLCEIGYGAAVEDLVLRLHDAEAENNLKK